MMSEKLKVDTYETEKYQVKILIRGYWYTIEFQNEEDALNFIDKKWDITWSDYTLIKISHAIF